MGVELIGQGFGLQSQFFDFSNRHFPAAPFVAIIDSLQEAQNAIIFILQLFGQGGVPGLDLWQNGLTNQGQTIHDPLHIQNAAFGHIPALGRHRVVFFQSSKYPFKVGVIQTSAPTHSSKVGCQALAIARSSSSFRAHSSAEAVNTSASGRDWAAFNFSAAAGLSFLINCGLVCHNAGSMT
jgi:hypothetical protein